MSEKGIEFFSKFSNIESHSTAEMMSVLEGSGLIENEDFVCETVFKDSL